MLWVKFPLAACEVWQTDPAFRLGPDFFEDFTEDCVDIASPEDRDGPHKDPEDTPEEEDNVVWDDDDDPDDNREDEEHPDDIPDEDPGTASPGCNSPVGPVVGWPAAVSLSTKSCRSSGLRSSCKDLLLLLLSLEKERKEKHTKDLS